MIFGYNTDVKSGNKVFHVQTEDRGDRNPVIDSVIYVKGRIVDRRRTPYVPGENTPEHLQEMVKQQHRELVDSIRNGTYVIPEQVQEATTAVSVAVAAVAAAPAKDGHAEAATIPPAVELLNAEAVEHDGKLLFRLRVCSRGSDAPVAGASVHAVLAAGETDEKRADAVAGPDGTAEITFDLPTAEGCAVMFQAGDCQRSDVIKFRLVHKEVD